MTAMDEARAFPRTEAMVAVGLAVCAAVCFRIPELFGLHLDEADAAVSFYLRNFGFFFLPFLAGFFLWKRNVKPDVRVQSATPFVVGILCLNLYPFTPGGNTEVLSALHILVALWLTVGYSYVAGHWRDHEQRMNFVRFTGEWLIYYVLIALGGGVLTLFTLIMFDAIGLDAEYFLTTWVIPSGVVGAVIIAAFLVEARLAVVENLVPVLTVLFTPLFTIALLAFIGAVLWTGTGIHVERNILIGFDLLLVLVVALFLFAISARETRREPGFFDALQLVLVVCALVVDALALSAILARISTFGFTPNRVAAFGLNIILVMNLARAALLHWQFLTRRAGFAPVVQWQTAFLPVYAVWAWVVVLLFPLVFGFI